MMKILPSSRFSAQYAKGNMSQRFKTMEELNEQFFQSAIELFKKKNHCDIRNITHRYNDFLPENKTVDIIPIPQKASLDVDGTVTIIESNNAFDGYAMEIATRRKHHKQFLHIKNFPDFMHESAHVLDYFLNPKFVANIRKMTELGIYDKKYFDIYDRLYYNDSYVGEKALKNKQKILKYIQLRTEKELADVPFDEKIVFLNYIKNNLITEHNAYNQDYKYMGIIKKMRNFKSLKEYENWNKYYFFPEKIEIINKLLKETIDSERNDIKIKSPYFEAKKRIRDIIKNIKERFISPR